MRKVDVVFFCIDNQGYSFYWVGMKVGIVAYIVGGINQCFFVIEDIKDILFWVYGYISIVFDVGVEVDVWVQGDWFMYIFLFCYFNFGFNFLRDLFQFL